MMKKLTTMLLTSALLTSQIAMAHSEHGQSTDDAAEYRQAVMGSIAWQMGAIKMILKDDHLDSKAVAKRAENLRFLSTLPLEGFKLGEVQDSAKAKIWDNWDDFSQKMQNLTETATALANSANKNSKLSILKKAFGKTAQACKSCHKLYKKR